MATNSALGQITSLSTDGSVSRAVIAVDAAPACPRCASGKGCGAALFSDRARQLELVVPDHMSVDCGDIVEISMTSENLLQASLVVYGAPLFAALLGAAVAYSFSMGDAAASIAALSGLVAGLVFARYRVSRQECSRNYSPAIVGCMGKASP